MAKNYTTHTTFYLSHTKICFICIYTLYNDVLSVYFQGGSPKITTPKNVVHLNDERSVRGFKVYKGLIDHKKITLTIIQARGLIHPLHIFSVKSQKERYLSEMPDF